MTRASTLMIIEDDPDFRDLVALVGGQLDFNIASMQSPKTLVSELQIFRPDVIVLDLMMPEADGVQVLRMLAHENCRADIVLISGADPRVLAATARVASGRGLQVRETLHKPVNLDHLASVLRRFTAPAPVTGGDLRGALENSQIAIHFQPKVALQTEAEWIVDGVEVLARWDHPRYGLILPRDFFSVAEATGHIHALSNRIFKKALAQARLLLDGGYRIDVSVNVPPYLLEDRGVPDNIARELAEYRLDPSVLIVEITEHSPFTDNASLMENLSRLRLKGVRLSIDDFGTGYSSLAQLGRIPFSELKIDKSIVAEIETSEENRTVVASIIELAHNLQLNVCAEGVETRQALECLRAMGCDQAQGFLVSKPLAASGLVQFLADNLYRHTSQLAAARTSA